MNYFNKILKYDEKFATTKRIHYVQDLSMRRFSSSKQKELQPVFVKLYAPNICLSINMAKFAVS